MFVIEECKGPPCNACSQAWALREEEGDVPHGCEYIYFVIERICAMQTMCRHFLET